MWLWSCCVQVRGAGIGTWQTRSEPAVRQSCKAMQPAMQVAVQCATYTLYCFFELAYGRAHSMCVGCMLGRCVVKFLILVYLTYMQVCHGLSSMPSISQP